MGFISGFLFFVFGVFIWYYVRIGHMEEVTAYFSVAVLKYVHKLLGITLFKRWGLFLSPSVWAGLSDFALTNRIWWK